MLSRLLTGSLSFWGYFVPLRPDKSIVESQTMQREEFVLQRRAVLERYLQRLAAHPVIRRSKELRVFLQVQGKLPLLVTTDVGSRMLDGAVKLPRQLFGEPGSVVVPAQEVLQPAKGGRDLLRIFKELKQALVNEWGGVMPPVVEEYREFSERKDKLQDFEHHLSNSSQPDTLHEYLGLMLAAHNTFSDRSSALLTVQTLSTELSSLQSRAEKLEAAASKIFGGDRSRIQRVEELKETIRATGDVKHCAVREYERIKGNNRFELERLDRERPIDFYNMLKGFITSQLNNEVEKLTDTGDELELFYLAKANG